MDFHFLVMEKSWKINVEKEGAPWLSVLVLQHFLSADFLALIIVVPLYNVLPTDPFQVVFAIQCYQ